MNNRLATLLATLTLLVSTGGCSGMKNFLFGRGAACSSCATAAPTYGIAPGMEPTCGYEPSCGREPVCGYEPAVQPGPFANLRRGCGLLGGQPTCNGTPDCGCGNANQTSMQPGIDSYYNEVYDPYQSGGEVIGSQVMGDGYNSYPTPGSVYSGPSVQDNFDARGDRIIRVDPIPGASSGTVVQP